MTYTIEQTEEEILSFQVSDEALEAAAGQDNAGAFEQTEEEILSFQVSDEAIEAAAGSAKENAAAFTLAFCSGLDTCPA